MKSVFLFIGLFAVLFSACVNQGQPPKNMDNLYAWCIVPFDSLKRTPEQRIEMLKRLGFNKYAYDWRDEHLDEMAHEFELARENNISVISVWMWIDQNSDRVRQLSESNERILSIIKKTGLQTQLWLGFNPNFFTSNTDSEAVASGAAMIKYIAHKAGEIGCKVALYNHGGWFGKPENQIKIIKALPDYDIGMIYNFHHAHDQLDTFNDNVPKMMPYLWFVNVNGMKAEGPKIITVGQGNLENDMIQTLLENGYNKPFGILGHIENEDVKEVLKRNIDGYFSLPVVNK